MKLVRLKVLWIGVLLVLLAPGLADAEPPPHLQWQNSNCWLLGSLYALLRMSGLTIYVLEHENDFKPGSFEAAYAKLVKAITTNSGDKNNHWAYELTPVQRAAERLVGLSKNAIGSPNDLFDHPHLFAGALHGLFDDFVGERPCKEVYQPILYAHSRDVNLTPQKRAELMLYKQQGQNQPPVKHPPYLKFDMGSGYQWNKVRIPFVIDTAPFIDPKLGIFEACEYELIVMAVMTNRNHFVTYVKDLSDQSWYYCDDHGGRNPPKKLFPKDRLALPVNNEILWNDGFEPYLLLYKRTKLVAKRDPLRERLEQERLEKERQQQEKLRQEKLRLERLQQEQREFERLQEEWLRKELLQQEEAEQKRLQQEQLRLENLQQERLRRERLEQERLQQEKLRQEELRQEFLQRERVLQEKLEQLSGSLETLAGQLVKK